MLGTEMDKMDKTYNCHIIWSAHTHFDSKMSPLIGYRCVKMLASY